ncbi:hypothetical protein OB920_17640 [Halobacteria archaeon HArc-gm2]|nr:hypothetical protein [Halobacteria archaeon HArc-gm2]
MPPSRRSSLVAGSIVGLIAAVAVQWPLGAGPMLTLPVGLFLGLGTAVSLWGIPRARWPGEDEGTPDAREFRQLVLAGSLPAFAITPVGLLTEIELGMRVALMGLVFGAGFTGFGGYAALLVAAHYRTGDELAFVPSDRSPRSD